MAPIGALWAPACEIMFGQFVQISKHAAAQTLQSVNLCWVESHAFEGQRPKITCQPTLVQDNGFGVAPALCLKGITPFGGAADVDRAGWQLRAFAAGPLNAARGIWVCHLPDCPKG